jgi:hypothetical protein
MYTSSGGHLRKTLLMPPPVPITLSAGQHVVLTNWLSNIEDGKATLEVGRSIPAEPLLSASFVPSLPPVKAPEVVFKTHLSPGSKPSVALWETRAPLEQGVYQLSAAVSAEYPIFRGPNPPAELKLWGGQELQDETVRKSAQSLQMIRTFAIHSPEEIVIQLIARASEDDLELDFHPPILTRLE